MSYIILSLGALLWLIGIYHLIKTFIFIKQSSIVLGKCISKQMKEGEDCFIVEFYYDDHFVESCFKGSLKTNEQVILRVLKKEKELIYKLNRLSDLFADCLILCPTGLILFLFGLFFLLK